MVENNSSSAINCCMGKHMGGDLVRLEGFMWFVKIGFYQNVVELLRHYRVKRYTLSNLKLTFQRYLGYPNQNIYNDQIFYNGRKTIGSCFKIIHDYILSFNFN